MGSGWLMYTFRLRWFRASLARPFHVPMILLHAAAAAAYALAAWSLWPGRAPDARRPAVSSGEHRRSFDLSVAFVLAALLLHAVALTQDVVREDGLDVSLDNALSVVAGLVVTLAWFSGLLRTMPSVGAVVLPLGAVASALPLISNNPHRFHLLTEPWAAAHVGVALVAYAMFIVAAVLALLIMGLETRLHTRRPSPGAEGGPSLLTLERLLFQLVGTGFLLLTLTIVSGALFSEQVFGRPLTFNRDGLGHKSVFTGLSWLTFGALLVGRWRYGWRGRAALRWILTGTVFLLLAYFGSKFVLEVVLGR